MPVSTCMCILSYVYISICVHMCVWSEYFVCPQMFGACFCMCTHFSSGEQVDMTVVCMSMCFGTCVNVLIIYVCSYMYCVLMSMCSC